MNVVGHSQNGFHMENSGFKVGGKRMDGWMDGDGDGKRKSISGGKVN